MKILLLIYRYVGAPISVASLQELETMLRDLHDSFFEFAL